MLRSLIKKVKPRKNESGYVLIWVLALLLLGGIIIGPLLLYVNTALVASHARESSMQRFYAADAGIEDAAYKIQHSDDYPDLPQFAGDVWEYPDYPALYVNGYEVHVSIENVWILSGLESEEHGTLPHQELVVVGQLINQPTTTLNGAIDDDDTVITVVSTVGFPDAGLICIDDELIQYGAKTETQFTGCTRGDNATGHSDGTTVYGQGTLQIDVTYDGSVGELKIDRIGAWLPAGFNYVAGSSAGIPDHEDIPDDPEEIDHRGGTALVWDFEPPQGIKFEELPTLIPSGSGFEPGAEFPMKRSMLFQFTPSPQAEPRGTFSWIRTTRHDIYLSWDTASATYKVTSTAQKADGGPQTTLESYIARTRLHNRVQQVYGDYRAIGNSLMRDITGDSRGIRDVLDPESTASVEDIPGDATVEAAYLYWSAWWHTEDADTEVTFHVEDTAGGVLFDGTVEATRWQILENKVGSWAYSCFADVTSLLKAKTSDTVTVSATGESESVTIAWIPGWFSTYADVKISPDNGNPGPMFLDGTPITNPTTITLNSAKPSAVLTSGTAPGDYDATIRFMKGDGWGPRVRVDGTTLWNGQSTDVSLETSGLVSEEVTITRSPDQAGVEATVKIVAASANPGDLLVDGDTIEPGGNVTLELDDSDPFYTLTLSDVDEEPCSATITCTEGRVLVVDGANSFILSAGGAFSGNGSYTVGEVQGDTGDEWSYAGWSLIIIYSSPSERAHQLYLYDDFLYSDMHATHTFTVEGFQVPELEAGEEEWGRLTVFVGEGDECYEDDYIEFNGSRLPRPGDPYDGINPQDNVWNGKSSGLAGLFIDGVDIDTFDVSDELDEGDTSAEVELGTAIDSWNLVYIILSFRTEHASESGLYPVGIITYTYEAQ